MECYVKLLQILSAVDDFKGATRLHKIAYIAQSLGLGIAEEFSWHLYGPYSPSMALRIEDLRALGALQEHAEQSPGSPRVFSVTPMGKEFVEVFGEKEEGTLEALVAKLHADHDRRQLELMASLIYLQRNGRTADQATTEITGSKDFRCEEVQRALEDIEILKQHYAADGASGDEAEAS